MCFGFGPIKIDESSLLLSPAQSASQVLDLGFGVRQNERILETRFSSANPEPRTPNPENPRASVCLLMVPSCLVRHFLENLLPAIRTTPHQNRKSLRHFLPQSGQAREVKLRISRSPKLCRQFGAPSQKTPGAGNGWPPAIQPIDLDEELSPSGLGSSVLPGVGGVRRQPFGGHRSSLAKGHRFSSH